MIIGEDLFEGHRWTLGVVLLVTVVEWTASAVCVSYFDPYLPTGNVHLTRETRGCIDFEKHAKRDYQPLKRD